MPQAPGGSPQLGINGPSRANRIWVSGWDAAAENDVPACFAPDLGPHTRVTQMRNNTQAIGKSLVADRALVVGASTDELVNMSAHLVLCALMLPRSFV